MEGELYRVVGWDDHFENSRTRQMKSLTWVPVPNKHDGLGYARIMSHKRGMEVYGAWHLILQVASKCEPRGTLIADSGLPLQASDIALMVRCQAPVIALALEYLASPEVQWLEVVTETVSGTRQEPDGQVSGGCQAPVRSLITNRIEENRREENRIEEKRVSNNAPAGHTHTHSQIVERAYFHIKGRLPRPDEPTTADWAWAKEAAPHMGADLDETIQAHLRRHAYKSPESLLQGITLDWYATASSGPPPAPDLDALTARIMGGKT